MEKDNISTLLRQLIKPFGYIRLKRKLDDMGYYFFNSYKKGTVEEKLILKVLRKSILINPIKEWIPDILCYVDGTSISDQVFAFCLKYPGKFRLTLLSQLAHMQLTEKQLLILNNIIATPEAFCQLLTIYAKDTSISVDKFEEFLMSNQRFFQDVNCQLILDNCDIKLSHQKQCILKKIALIDDM